jgi:hypothetical protein
MGYTKPLSHHLDRWTIRPPLISFADSLCAVDQRSPVGHRKALEQIAYYFKREMRFDFAQYHHTDRGPGYVGYLFPPEYFGHRDFRTPVIGACLFRSHAIPGVPWTLAWVWIHPMSRRQGILSMYWSRLRKRHGLFFVDTPRSTAMQAFLEKHDPELLADNDRMLAEWRREYEQETKDAKKGT